MSKLECKNCCYYGTQSADEHDHCMFVELRGDPSWVDVPPCEQDDYDDDNYDQYDYEEEDCND